MKKFERRLPRQVAEHTIHTRIRTSKYLNRAVAAASLAAGVSFAMSAQVPSNTEAVIPIERYVDLGIMLGGSSVTALSAKQTKRACEGAVKTYRTAIPHPYDSTSKTDIKIVAGDLVEESKYDEKAFQAGNVGDLDIVDTPLIKYTSSYALATGSLLLTHLTDRELSPDVLPNTRHDGQVIGSIVLAVGAAGFIAREFWYRASEESYVAQVANISGPDGITI